MNDRPTPETDALRESIDSGADTEAQMTAFARKLEQERDEARGLLRILAGLVACGLGQSGEEWSLEDMQP